MSDQIRYTLSQNSTNQKSSVKLIMKKLLMVITSILLTGMAVNATDEPLPQMEDGGNGAVVDTTAQKTVNVMTAKSASFVTPRTVPVNNTPQVRVYTIAVLGPSTNNWVIYTNFSDGVVTKIHNGIALSNSWNLATGSFIQGVDKTNDSVWFATHIVSTSTNYMFSPNWLTFTESSSEPANVFSNKVVYTDPYIYTPQAMGIVWGPGGNTILTTGQWTNLVNEFIFIGHQSKYFVVSTVGQSNSVDGYFNSAAVNFRITGTFNLNDGVNPVVSASHSFYRQTVPSQPALGIARLAGQEELVSLTGTSTNDSWIIQRSPALLPTTWTDVATIGGGLSNFVWQYGTNSTEFFRAALQ